MLYIAKILSLVLYYTSVVNFDDVQTLEGAFTNLFLFVLNTPIVSNCCLGCCVQQVHLLERGQESLKFRFDSLTTNYIYIQCFDKRLNPSFVSTFGEI